MAQDTPRSRAPSVPTLPEEIWDMITGYTDYAEQKQLRLACRTLSRIAAAHLFNTIYLEIQKDSIERMINVAFHHVLRYHVKQLVILESSQLVLFGTWREWYTHIENRADYPGGPLNARSPWMMDEILDLYEEYKAECLALSQFLFCVRSRSSGLKSLGERYYTSKLEPDNQMAYACDHFDEALARFKNLKTVQQRRWWQRTGPFCWRGLRFSVPDRRRRQVADHEDDMLPLTFVLRGLGWAHSMGESNLKSLDIGTSGLAFWTEHGLRHNLWGTLANGSLRDTCESEVKLMRTSFYNLTYLRCSLSGESLTVKAMLDSFAAFLGTAEMLQDLDLNFVERKGGEDIGEQWDLFNPLSTQGNRWKKLRRLKLSAYTGGRSLSAFLINQSSSLRSLTLYDCNLVTSEDSWPELFEHARDALSLDSIFLVNLFDAYPDKNSDIKGYLIDYMDDCEIYHGFKDKIVDYILKKTDQQPVWDHKPIYDDHLSKCEGCDQNRALHDEASADEHSIFFELDLLPIVADLGLL
ncbi:chromatin modification-related protein eaf7 protein [Diplodia corticola]|uniref:Chromatin modification-related protein eaf7 protein n=1 Tax=Diplodia corticola TaxID=236234 RepID=A0A1J9R4I3_9PEZI|nr:chromatin modification-related protein eaf7 protein [Diplodia corticola]OJD35489.1 chromatin modification-related protein eaf7 protein [Diplodia corticola]